MKFLIFIFSILFSISSFGQNQQQIDSLKKNLNSTKDLRKKCLINLEISKLIQNKNPDSSKIYAKNAEQFAIKVKDNELISRSYFQEGFIYYRERKDDISLLYFNKIDSLYVLDNSTFESYFMSIIYRSEISKFTFTLEGVMKAKKYILEALNLAEKHNNDKLINLAKYRLAEWHGFISQEVSPKEHLDSATAFIKEVIPYYTSIKDYSYLAKSYHTLSSIAMETKNYVAAEKYLKKRLQVIKRTNDSILIGQAYNTFGSLYRNMNKPDKGLMYLDSAAIIFKKTGFSTAKRRKDLYKDYAYLYESKKDYKKAFEKMYQALLLKDTIYDDENTKKAMELEKKYQTQKKEHEISLLKTQKANQRNVSIGVISLISLTGLLFFFLFRNRQKTAKKLKELDKVKSTFFANISHEFRTPLTLISTPIQEALNDDSLSEKNRRHFEMAQRNSERLLTLVNQILELSKIDSGNLKLQIQEGNILQLISALSDSFSFAAEQNNILFKKNIEKDINQSWFDKDAIEKIVINLLSNAIKYTPKKGSVVCNASVKDRKLYLEIKNSGIGLTKVELKAVFQRFYQTTEQNQGSGIGLSLVKELVELHKGHITVSSEPNKWTTFKVILPISKNDFSSKQIIITLSDKGKVDIPIISNPYSEVDEEFSDNEKPILLIVEDNTDLRGLMQQHFEASYNVLTAPNGDIGVRLALEHIPDLIISDIMMPVKDGIELTKTLKNDECTAHIPIILLTAKVDIESQYEGIDIGADDYITKPFDNKLLDLKVKKLIESRKKLQERYSQELILIPKYIAVTNLDKKFLTKVRDILDKKLVESSFNIEDFSKALGMSRMQLHRKIKALTGLPASEFIRSQRLKLAAQLLKTSTINISQVGYSVGFNDHSYFDKCFKEVYNCTPTEYSKRKDF